MFICVHLWFLSSALPARADAGDAATQPDVPPTADAPAAGDAATPRVLPSTAVGGRSAAAAIDPARVPLGGKARYTLTVRHPPGDEVRLPPRGTNPFGPFRATGLPVPGARPEGLVVASTFVFDLVALEPGTRGIPPVEVSLLAPEGVAYELAAPAVRAEIADPTANEPIDDLAKKLRGAKGADGRVDRVRPYVVYVRDWTLAVVLGALGGALVVALLAVLVTRRVMRRRRSAVPAGPPPVPPYPAVRRRLAPLRLPGAYARMGAKAFHVEVAEAVKEYLGRRHGIDAPEMTSEELLAALPGLPMGNVTPLEMEMFLGSCDIVKFAKGEPAEREALDVLGTGERIVEQVETAVTAIEMRRAAEEAARAAAAAAAAAQSPPGVPATRTPPAQGAG